MDTGKALKMAAIYTVPWFVISLLLGWVMGAFVFPFISPAYAATGMQWLISGLISTLVVWSVWLKFDIPGQYLDKYAK